jgi:hypothetical protein
MLNRILNWLLDLFLARIGDARVEQVRQELNKEAADAQARMDAVRPVDRNAASQRLHDGTA